MLAFAFVSAVFGLTDDGPDLDSATLTAIRKRVTGKTTWDRQAGVIQIVYDFAAVKQGSDFLIDEKPAKVKGGLTLSPAAEAIHIVPWRTVQVECVISMTKIGGVLMKSETSKATFNLVIGNQSVSALIEVPRYGMARVIPKADQSGLKTIKLELAEKTCSGSFAATQIRQQDLPGPAGRIVFSGGSNGYNFRTVVLRGRPDADWLKGLVEKKSK
jgi:hypothetical protein